MKLSALLRTAAAVVAVTVVWCIAPMREATATPILLLSNTDMVSYKSNILSYDAATGASLGEVLVNYGGGFIGGFTYGADGNLYVSDFNGLKIDRYNGTTGVFIDKFATVTSSSPYQPLFGPDGNLYLGQAGGAVTKYDGLTGQSLGTFVSRPAGAFDFGGMAFHNGGLYVSYLGASGSLSRYDAITGGNAQEVYAGFSSNGPRAPLFDNAGNMYVPDWQTNKIYAFNENSLTLTGTITTRQGTSPMSLSFDGGGNLLVLSDNGSNSQIDRYDPATGALLGTLVAPGAGGLGRGNNLTFLASEPSSVPEIDPSTGSSVLSLVAGVLAMIEQRRRRAALVA